MIKIAVINLQKKALVDQQKIKKLIRKVLNKERPGIEGEITLSLVSDPLIRKLNMLYLKKNLPTDVLAFNSTERFNKNKFYADIIVSSDTAAFNAKVFRSSLPYELNLYIVHGLLHLLGYNHNCAKRRKVMLKKELEYVHT